MWQPFARALATISPRFRAANPNFAAALLLHAAG
jgi:hypothetical protein